MLRTRRTFVKLAGALTSFVFLVRCKTVGAPASAVKADDAATVAKFGDLSKALTGFDAIEGSLAPQYLQDLRMAQGDAAVDALLAKYGEIAAAGGNVEDKIASEIMENDTLRPVASAAIMLWYSGAFNKLEPQQPVAIKAYQKGLQWQSFDGKPMGIPMDETGAWGQAPQ